MNIPNSSKTDLSGLSCNSHSEHSESNCKIPELFLPNPLNKNVVKTTKAGIGNESGKLLNVKTKIDCNHLEEINLLKQKLQIAEKNVRIKEAEIERLTEKLSVVKSNIDQFSYIACHDLKEPLRMVTSYLGLLKNKFGAELNDKANTYIDFAIDGGAKLHTMFNSLVDLSQTGRADEQKIEIDFNNLLEEVQINISKKIKDTNAQIKICSKLPSINVYEKSVNRLLENLLCNAIKFSCVGQWPVIEIDAKENKTFWEFCISDNGIGINACSYSQIFAVFSKLHNSALYPGNGIGLAICKKAVEHHGGLIWVDAELNKGSRFYFTLPK